jgi:hypothetical protein
MRKIAITGLVIALAACSSQNENELEAGNWKQTATIKSVSFPGAPPAMQAAAKSMIGKTQTNESCLSEAEAKLGVQRMAEAMQDGQCKSSDFQTGDGRISGKINCQMGTKGQAEFAITGTYTRTRLDMNADMTTQDPSIPGGKVQMQMAMTAEHAGECKSG